jgi:RNA polymerase sigma factor (sigma-70 family)
MSDRSGGFSIACVSKLKHGVLWNIMKKNGWSQGALAKALGIDQTTLGRIVNLKHVPDFTKPHRKDLKERLEILTGLDVRDLFPSELLTPEFLQAPKCFEQTSECPQRLLYDEATGMLSLPQAPDEILMDKEEANDIEVALRVLTPRQREVFDLCRQGLTRAEIARRIPLSNTQVSNICSRIKRRIGMEMEFQDRRKDMDFISVAARRAKAGAV